MGKIVVNSEQGYQTAIHIRQHTVMADELVNDGGTDSAPTSMEILLGTAGACIVVTTKAFAQGKGWSLENVQVEMEMERIKSQDYPGYQGPAPFIHEIRERITFGGPLTDQQKETLMGVAKKCPVHLTLENPVFFVPMPGALQESH